MPLRGFNIKKLDYEKLAKERGLKYIRENNGRVFIEDEFGLEHSFSFYRFSQGSKPNIRSVNKDDRTKYYVQSIIKKHPDVELYTDFSSFYFEGSEKPSKFICRSHGEYVTSPSHLLSRGRQCKKCATEVTMGKTTKTQKWFLETCKEKHGDKYDYSKTKYKKNKDTVVVTCKLHGDFTVNAGAHYYSGVGCRDCCKNLNSYSRTDYKKLCGLGSEIYILRLQSKEDKFFKIGISKNIRQRVLKIARESCCDVDVIYSNFYEDAGVAWDMEKFLHKEYKDFRYKPKEIFGGSTECFKGINTQEAIKILQCVA